MLRFVDQRFRLSRPCTRPHPLPLQLTFPTYHPPARAVNALNPNALDAGRMVIFGRQMETQIPKLSKISSLFPDIFRPGFSSLTLAQEPLPEGSSTFSLWLVSTVPSFCTMPEGQRISTSALRSAPSPKCTVRSLLDAYPTQFVTQRDCVRLADLQLTCAPIAERLLCLPFSRNCSHCFRGLRFHHNSIRSPIAVTATSILPSWSKSANAAPRCNRAAANSFPAAYETSANFPPAFRKTRFACASFSSNPP